MNALLGILLYALIVGLLAFVLGMLLRMRQSALGYVGAGFLGDKIGGWILQQVNVSEPLDVRLADFGVWIGVLGALIGTVLVLLVFRLVRR
jgi:uncharacterized membrane protein YeaQ/YmgE (transglycosylase-associated protein family)